MREWNTRLQEKGRYSRPSTSFNTLCKEPEATSKRTPVFSTSVDTLQSSTPAVPSHQPFTPAVPSLSTTLGLVPTTIVHTEGKTEAPSAANSSSGLFFPAKCHCSWRFLLLVVYFYSATLSSV